MCKLWTTGYGKDQQPHSLPSSVTERLPTWMFDGMFQTAFSLAQLHQRKKSATGIPLLDDLLGGGFEAGLSYLLYGSPFCTHLLQQFIATALQQFAPEENIVVIDANNGIRPDTILSYLRTTQLSAPPATYLNHLHVARAFTTEQLLSLLVDAPITVQTQEAAILFVNGLLHLIQEEEEPPYSTNQRSPLDPRVFRRAQFSALLKQLAFIQQIAVVVSADAPKRLSQPPLCIGQTTRHRFQVLIHHARQANVETFTLEKHPCRSWQQQSTITPHRRRRLGSQQTTLFDS